MNRPGTLSGSATRGGQMIRLRHVCRSGHPYRDLFRYYSVPPGVRGIKESMKIQIKDLRGYQGRTATLCGWLHGSRSAGGILFLLVRDGTGVCQCLVEASETGAYRQAVDLPRESSLSATGMIRADARAPGGLEMVVSSIAVIHKAADYPISRKTHGVEFLMNHRHLWLRSQRQAAIMRIRHTLVGSIREFLNENGFTLIDTPILISAAAEGAGTLFPVEFFEQPAYLAQTGQLHLECACMALGKVYCFGPAFRAEKSKTRRHLVEFWMVEPEVAFADLNDIIVLAEEMLSRALSAVLDRHENDLNLLERDLEPLRKIRTPFPRISYTQAVELLRSPAVISELQQKLESDRLILRKWAEELAALENAKTGNAKQRERVEAGTRLLRENIRDLEQELISQPQHIEQARSFQWGKDIGGSDETIISRHFRQPVFISEYPKDAKAFYMKRRHPDDKVVQNADLLAPEGYGEIAGGSQREDSLDMLMERMREADLDPADYGWYIDLRRYGSVPHSGFGLGIERTLAWICGLKHVREAIPFPRLMGRMTG